MQRVICPNRELIPEVEKLLSEGKSVTMRVKGDSMLPFINGKRDSVELRKVQSIRVGDIVLARLADMNYVIHRIIRISGDDVVLMGDGNLCGIETCRRADVLGEVFQIIRNGKAICCTCGKERVKAQIWCRLLPIRRYLLGLYRRMN